MRDESKKKKSDPFGTIFSSPCIGFLPLSQLYAPPVCSTDTSWPWQSIIFGTLLFFRQYAYVDIYIFFPVGSSWPPRHSFLPDGRCHRRWQFKGALCVPTRAAWAIVLWHDVARRYSTNICWYSPQNASASDMAAIYGSNVSWKRFWSQKCKNKL